MDAYYTSARKATSISLTTNAGLAFCKIFVGLISGSHALLADGFHSLADVLSDGMVLIATRFGSEAADRDHPYGHGRIETLAAMALGLLVLGAAAGILLDAAYHFWGGETRRHTVPLLALSVGAISILANEGLFRYLRHVGNRLGSNLLRANAWHNRSDAAASAVVVIGLLSERAGLPHGDALAALCIAVMVARMGIQLMWHSAKELIDTGVSVKTLAEIRAAIKAIPGILGVHQLRTRLMNGKIYVDVHILVDSLLTVSEGHFIGDRVERELEQNFEQIVDVVVHVDAEDDRDASADDVLPSREALMNDFATRCAAIPPVVGLHYLLHYLHGKVGVEIFVPLRSCEDAKAAERIARAVEHCISTHPMVGFVRSHLTLGTGHQRQEADTFHDGDFTSS